METKARQQFEQLSKEKVYENGLIIDPEFPFLAASPGNRTLLLLFYYQNISYMNYNLYFKNNKLLNRKLIMYI